MKGWRSGEGGFTHTKDRSSHVELKNRAITRVREQLDSKMELKPWNERFFLSLAVCSYPRGAAFTTKLDLKNECLIYHKTVFGTRTPAFSVVVVGRWRSAFCVVFK